MDMGAEEPKRPKTWGGCLLGVGVILLVAVAWDVLVHVFFWMFPPQRGTEVLNVPLHWVEVFVDSICLLAGVFFWFIGRRQIKRYAKRVVEWRRPLR